jgi:hypothetical protein
VLCSWYLVGQCVDAILKVGPTQGLSLLFCLLSSAASFCLSSFALLSVEDLEEDCMIVKCSLKGNI